MELFILKEPFHADAAKSGICGFGVNNSAVIQHELKLIKHYRGLFQEICEYMQTINLGFSWLYLQGFYFEGAVSRCHICIRFGDAKTKS